MTSILPEIFAPPRIATKGRFGFSSAPPRYSSSLLHQEAGDGRLEEARDALGGRVRAVRRAERVVHVEVAEPRERRARALRRSSPRPPRKRVFSSSSDRRRRRAIVRRRRRGVVSVLVDEAHRVLRAAARRGARATGSSEYFASGFPFGRPRCESSTTRAPRSSSASIVGSAARMRVSSVTRAPSSGTLKSTRTSARLPRSAASRKIADRLLGHHGASAARA